MADTVFACASLLAIIAWLSLALGLIVQPGTQRRRLLRFAGRHVPVILCALYAGVLWTYWGKVPNGGFANLTSVVALFSMPGKMLGGWVHFLAVDLLVGRGVIDDGLAQGYPRAALIGVLPVIFLYGPLGILAYLFIGMIVRRVASQSEV